MSHVVFKEKRCAIWSSHLIVTKKDGFSFISQLLALANLSAANAKQLQEV